MDWEKAMKILRTLPDQNYLLNKASNFSSVVLPPQPGKQLLSLSRFPEFIIFYSSSESIRKQRFPSTPFRKNRGTPLRTGFAGACPELVEGAQNDIFGLNCLIDEEKSFYLLDISFPKIETLSRSLS